MSGAVNSTAIGRPGDPETGDQVLVRAVSPGYFEAMGVPSIRGRGIRMALGATGGAVVREIVARFAAIAAGGLAAGLLAAVAAGRSLSHLLVGVPATDPAAFALATVVFALVAVLTAWIPAKRAAAVDPIRALRAE